MSKSLKPAISDLQEYVSTYFNGTKPPKMAWEFFWKEQAELQRSLLSDAATLSTYLDDYPHYVAAALVSQVTFHDTSQNKLLVVDYTKVTIESLREAKALGVKPEARPLMDAIAPTGKLPKILSLLAQSTRSLNLPPQPTND